MRCDFFNISLCVSRLSVVGLLYLPALCSVELNAVDFKVFALSDQPRGISPSSYLNVMFYLVSKIQPQLTFCLMSYVTGFYRISLGN
jgi:hypothetical protein